MINVGTSRTVGIVDSMKKGIVETSLKLPLVVNSGDRAAISRLVEDQFPVILVNRKVCGDPAMDRTDYVVVENVKGGFLAVEHLIKMGHRRIGIISGSSDSSAAALPVRSIESKKVTKDKTVVLSIHLFIFSSNPDLF